MIFYSGGIAKSLSLKHPEGDPKKKKPRDLNPIVFLTDFSYNTISRVFSRYKFVSFIRFFPR